MGIYTLKLVTLCWDVTGGGGMFFLRYVKGFLAWRATRIKLGKYRGGFMERLQLNNRGMV